MTAPPAVAASLGQVQARIVAIEARIGVRATPGSAASSAALRPAAAGAASASFDAALARAASASGIPVEARPGAELAPTGQAVATAAREYLGIPYVWGGTDPATGLDCSGFTQHVFRRAGVELPRVSVDQARRGEPVTSLAGARPGDLLGWDNGPRNNGVDHVAIYLGDGKMIEAPGRGGHVRITDVRTPPDAIRRILPDGPPVPGPGGIAGLAGLAGVAPAGAPVASATGAVPFAHLFEAAGLRHGVDPALLALVAEHESGFDPRAVSRAGAQGLMQLMPATAAGLGVQDPFDPAQAVEGAARLLADHLRAFGSVDLALAAYNAGPGAVRRHGGIPPFGETQRYVANITARYGGAR